MKTFVFFLSFFDLESECDTDELKANSGQIYRIPHNHICNVWFFPSYIMFFDSLGKILSRRLQISCVQNEVHMFFHYMYNLYWEKLNGNSRTAQSIL